ELFVSQRNSEEFYSRYKFTAKELDNETSYTYFGARYYDSELRGWLSMNSNEQEIIIYYKEEKYVIEDYETPAAIILNQGIRNNHWGKTLNTVDPLSTKTKKENKNVPML
ncbi:MAG: hypothetical protein PHF55_01085, partial [Bacteroidales bacterium]|nr:hypothetical protein [Bacteroidales bacterium]